MDQRENPLPAGYIVACVFVAAITWRLLSHCLATGAFTEPFPSNRCLCWLHNCGFQQTCHNIHICVYSTFKFDIYFTVYSLIRYCYSFIRFKMFRHMHERKGYRIEKCIRSYPQQNMIKDNFLKCPVEVTNKLLSSRGRQFEFRALSVN
jgi:hypothetical protein